MENENKDYQDGQTNESDERAERLAEDISEKISDAAAEIQDEVDSANEAAAEESDETEDIFAAAYAGEEGFGDETDLVEPVKEPKKVTLKMGAFITSLIGCAVVGALIFFLATSIPTWVANMPEGSTVSTVNGEKVTDMDLEYYIYTTAMAKFSEMNQDNPSADIAGFDWEQTVDGDKKLSDVIKEEALNEAKNNILTIQAAAKNGEEWTDQDEQQIQSAVNNFVSQYGEEGFTLRAKTMGISTVKQYGKMYRQMTQYSNAQAKMEEDINAFIPEGTDLNSYIQDDRASVQHILIKNTPDASASPAPSADPAATPAPSEDPKAKAEMVLASAKGGEDFGGLMETFNEDTGETDTGYTFRSGEMDPAFEAAAFALKIGDISDLVESTYGYHIIKRIPGMYEVQGYLASQAKITDNKSKIDKISVADVMKMASDASNELQNQQSAQSGSSSATGSASSQG